jgi:hypothetical protein
LNPFVCARLVVFVTEAEQIAKERRLVHSVLEDARPFIDEPLLKGFVELLQSDDAHVVRRNFNVPEFYGFFVLGVVHGLPRSGLHNRDEFHIVKKRTRLVTENCADPAAQNNFDSSARIFRSRPNPLLNIGSVTKRHPPMMVSARIKARAESSRL